MKDVLLEYPSPFIVVRGPEVHSTRHPNCHLPASHSNQFTMAGLLNSLGTAVSPYVLPIVEKNVVPDFVVRFGESSSHTIMNKSAAAVART